MVGTWIVGGGVLDAPCPIFQRVVRRPTPTVTIVPSVRRGRQHCVKWVCTKDHMKKPMPTTARQCQPMPGSANQCQQKEKEIKKEIKKEKKIEREKKDISHTIS